MKKFNFKSFILGVLVTGLILGLAVPGLAAATTRTVEVYYNSIKVRLNGKPLVLKDGKGNIIEPFIIDGTNYLPVRALAEALGLQVSWDAANQTVVLGQDPELNQPSTWLGDLETFTGVHKNELNTSGLYESNSYHLANDGSTYERILYHQSMDVSYLLNGQYRKLTGTFFLGKSAKNGFGSGRAYYDKARYLIYLDDKLVYTSDIIGPGIPPQNFSIDVTNAFKMKIVHQVGYDDDNGEPHMSESFSYTKCTPIGNAALWK